MQPSTHRDLLNKITGVRTPQPRWPNAQYMKKIARVYVVCALAAAVLVTLMTLTFSWFY